VRRRSRPCHRLRRRSRVGRSAIEIGWFVMLVPVWLRGKRTAPILRAHMAPCLESTDSALSQSGSASRSVSDSSRQIPRRAPHQGRRSPAPGVRSGVDPVSCA
jgi:hypothetical protein